MDLRNYSFHSSLCTSWSEFEPLSNAPGLSYWLLYHINFRVWTSVSTLSILNQQTSTCRSLESSQLYIVPKRKKGWKTKILNSCQTGELLCCSQHHKMCITPPCIRVMGGALGKRAKHHAAVRNVKWVQMQVFWALTHGVRQWVWKWTGGAVPGLGWKSFVVWRRGKARWGKMTKNIAIFFAASYPIPNLQTPSSFMQTYSDLMY